MELPSENNILELKDLSTSFFSDQTWKEAVRHVSVNLKSGKTLGIVGESGSGKSVSSLSIMGLLPKGIGKISQGTITFQGKTLNSLSEKEYQQIRGNQIAMVFQEPMTSLNPLMTCGDQVAESLIIHQKITKKQAKERVVKLFEKVQLPNAAEIFDRYPHELSGGQKQRVVISMALICNPDLIIADEPTTALDVTVQQEILKLLKSLQQNSQVALIFISHDLDVVKNIADDILVMYKGDVVEYGSRDEIFNHPNHPYTRGLINCKPPIDKRPLRLPIIQDFIDHPDGFNVPYEKAIDREERHQLLYSERPILSVKNLSKTYKKSKGLFSKSTELFKAVDDVSFDIFPGETLGLVGESGCGKSTLSRCVLKLLDSSQGQIFFNGKDISNLKGRDLRAIRKDFQIIFQDPYSSLNPSKTIGSAIVEPMKVHQLFKNDSERKKKAIELLEKTGLMAEHFDRYPHEFSGGQRQRVVIARTLALSPSLIICDESVSALDVSVQAQVLNLLNDLKKEYNLTYLFISHDMSVVKYMSDRVMVMNKGEIVECQEADKLFSSPAYEYTRKLIQAIPK